MYKKKIHPSELDEHGSQDVSRDFCWSRGEDQEAETEAV